MQINKSSPVPAEIQAVQQWLISGFIEYGAVEYKGILDKRMFGIYGDLYEYLSNNEEKTPEFFTICHGIGNEHMVDIMNLSEHIFSRFDLPKYAKQLFEYYVTLDKRKTMGSLEDVKKIYDKLDYISTGSKIAGIHEVFMKVENNIEIARERGDEPLGYRTGIETIDKHCEGLQPGTVMTINAYSNTGKSKLSYYMTNSFLRQGKKVLYYSLEVTADKVLLNLLSHWYGKDYYVIAKGKELIDFSEYYDIGKTQLEIVDNIYDIDGIIRHTELVKPDIVVIDFVQNITQKGGNGEYERMTNVAVEIQQLAIRNNIAILDLSQISNEGTGYTVGGRIPSKGSGALVASSDVGLMLYKKDDQFKLTIAKNKFGMNNLETTLEVNFSKGTFTDLGPNEF